MANERLAYNITNLRAYSESDCVSDHLLEVINVRVKLKEMSMEITPGIFIYDIDKLKGNRKFRDH